MGLVCGGCCDSGPCHLLLLLRGSTKTLEGICGREFCGGSNPGLLQRQREEGVATRRRTETPAGGTAHGMAGEGERSPRASRACESSRNRRIAWRISRWQVAPAIPWDADATFRILSQNGYGV